MLVTILNAVIDIYSDEGKAYDTPVFVNGGFLQVLTPLVGRVRADVGHSPICLIPRGLHSRLQVRKIDKRKLPGLMARAEETYENLAAFVKYRRNLHL